MPGPAPVVLAFSGRPGAGALIPRLAERTGLPVVTVTVDLGQGGDLEQITADARARGAARAHVVDGRERFAAEVILPALRAGAAAGPSGGRVAALARPAIVASLADVARMEGTSLIAHGASGADRLTMNLLVADAAPGLTVVEAERAAGGPAWPAVAANLWGRTVSLPNGAATGDAPSGVLYERTSPPDRLQPEPAVVELTFEHGLPVAVNGIAMPFVEMVEVVETIAGDHGVGRRERLVGDRGDIREITEAPAAVTLGLALGELERAVLPPRLAELKTSLAKVYGTVIDDGAWFSRTRGALDAFVASAATDVSGVVRVQLFRGECRIVEATAPAAVL